MQRKPPLHVFGRPFYVKVAAASFALGACIEGFMIATGFYDQVTVVEAERRLEAASRQGPTFGQRAPDPWAPRRGALPPDAEKHAAALWAFLDELAEDPEAYQQFLNKQAEAAGVGDMAAFRARLAQSAGGGAGATAPGPADVAAAAEALLADSGKALPSDLVARLASLGSGGGGGSSGARASPAAASPPPRRAPLVQELTPEQPSPVASAPPKRATPPPRAPPVPTHTVALEAPTPDAPHGVVVLTVQLLDVASAAEVTLEAEEWQVVLLRASAAPDAPPLLRTALPARCEPDRAAARWDKRARRLTIRLPRAPAPP